MFIIAVFWLSATDGLTSAQVGIINAAVIVMRQFCPVLWHVLDDEMAIKS